MTAVAKTERPRIKFSCREARLVIRSISLRKNGNEMREEELAAVGHYLTCKKCRDTGLANIHEEKLTCREAILVWAEASCALWQNCAPYAPLLIANRLVEHYAVEHVWGKYQWKKTPRGGNGWDEFYGCSERACLALHSYWSKIPMSSGAGDGPQGVICLFPFILHEIFIKEGWSLNKLFEVQRKRVAALLEDIAIGGVNVGHGHYNSAIELFAETQQHIATLQRLALRVAAKQ
jgi:hypothetical protein